MADLTVEVLREIRDEIRGLKADTNARLTELKADTNARFAELKGETNELRRAIVASETHVATELVAVGAALKDVVHLLRANLDLGPRVEKLEREVEQLKSRLPDA